MILFKKNWNPLLNQFLFYWFLMTSVATVDPVWNPRSHCGVATFTRREVTRFIQELCDVGSFKLLGWMLKITGTWNCLNHTSCMPTDWGEEETKHSQHLTQHHFFRLFTVSFVQLTKCFIFLCCYMNNLMDKTNYSHFRFVAFAKSPMWIQNTCSLMWNWKWLHGGVPICCCIRSLK